jgi:hypothetical protein
MKYAEKKLNNGLKPFTWGLFYYLKKREELFGPFMFGVEGQMK